MSKIIAPSTIGFDKFMTDYNPTKEDVKYGLPLDIKYCQSCVISNQKPSSTVEHNHTNDSPKETIFFDEASVCDACRVAEQKRNLIDWEEREAKLRDLCDKHRSRNGSYDCIVPGSGGKDSFYAFHILKNKYGMHPLTVTWAPNLYTDWGWKNFQSWIHAGADNYLLTPDGRTHRLLTRLAVEKLLHPFQAFIFGQKSYAPKMASLFNIPLIFYGENEAEYGNPISDTYTAKRDWSYFTAQDKSQIYLGGVSVEELICDFGLKEQDLIPYMPLRPDEVEKKNIEVQYLGYYLKWHPQSCYYYAVEHGGFMASPERTAGTYSKYNSIDDKIDDFHYYTLRVKFGIGRATYDAAQEIRSGDITRDEGVALIRKFDHEFPERFSDQIFKYLSLNEKEFPIASKQFEEPILTRAYFDALANTFRSPHLWMYQNGDWKLRHPIE